MERPLERKMTEASMRYRASMSLSAHFDPVAMPPPPLDRRRTRASFFMGNSRVDPASFLRGRDGQLAEGNVARQRLFKTNFEGGNLTVSEEATQRPRRVSLIDPPKAAMAKEEVAHRGKKVARSLSPDADKLSVTNGSVTSGGGSVVTNNNSATMSSVMMTPQRSREERSPDDTSPHVKTAIRVNIAAREANHMDTTVLTHGRACWSRKKSIDASNAAFLAMTSPKKYGFSKPPKEPSLVTGHGVATTNHHRRNFSMVVCSQQAVTPPWATDYNS